MKSDPQKNAFGSTESVGAGSTLVDLLAESFVQFSDRVAIDGDDFTIKYRHLEAVTRQIVESITERFSPQQLKTQPVAIVLPRSAELYVAQVAVLRAGGFFLAIDPATPRDRIDYLIEDSQAIFRLCGDEPSADTADSISIDLAARLRVARSTESNTSSSLKTAGSPVDGVAIRQDDIAYLVYTSGSTGRPKGVAVSHRAIVNHNRWCIEAYGKTEDDRCLQFTSPGFDVCIEEVFTTLNSGGCLIPLSSQAMQTPTDFFQWADQQKFTLLTLPVSFWEVLVLAGESASWPESLRLIIFGGDRANPGLVQRWHQTVGDRIALVNAYGPTETTITASHCKLKPEQDITIGLPVTGAEFFIVDADNRIVSGEGEGELLIGGAGVALGYWKRPQLTAEKFVQMESVGRCYRTGDRVRRRGDGQYEFMGRLDDQVKVAGHRIEPAEIAIAMEGHPQIEQAFVNPNSNTGATKLLGYYVATEDVEGLEPDLVEFLKQTLPVYMVPSRLIRLDQFPLTDRGKVDRNQLPVPAESRPSTDKGNADDQFETATQRQLAGIWKEVLKLDSVSGDDNFFTQGGDSLLAMKMVIELKNAFSLRIPIATLIPNPTLVELAEFIDHEIAAGQGGGGNRSAPTITQINCGSNPTDLKRPEIVCIHAAGGGGMFYWKLFDSQAIQGPVLVLESPYLHGTGPVACHEQSVEEIAEIYTEELLRRFELGDSVILAGYSLGGLLAFEMAQMLTDRGVKIEKIVNVDAPNPRTIGRQNLGARFLRNFSKMKNPATYWKEFSRNRERSLHKREIKELEQAGLGPKENQRSLALEMIYCDLIEHYQPGYFDGDMIVIRSTVESARFSVPSDYGWSSHVKNLRVDRTPGGHLSIFYDPWFKSLRAAFLKAFTDGVE